MLPGHCCDSARDAWLVGFLLATDDGLDAVRQVEVVLFQIVERVELHVVGDEQCDGYGNHNQQDDGTYTAGGVL